MSHSRRYPAGAEVLPEGGVHFRVWAPKRERVEVVLESGPGAPASLPLCREGREGYHSLHVPGAAAGTRYRFRLDGAGPFPDPASRRQPEGPHGPSEAVDPAAFRWTDSDWRGARLEGQVVYELHTGSFTPEGTWDAARRELPELAACGIGVIEMMPVADFPGRFGWGYDGVALYAPASIYGEPDSLRRFIDDAHRHGIAIILDVVYNHLGPDGCYLREFSDHYFSTRYDNDWGDAINFDDEHAGPVRDFFASNAAYWVDEYHFDGLRLDATQQIYDASEDNIMAVIGRRVRQAARGRETIVVAENEPQHTRLVRPEERGGYGLDGLWNDDFHHSAMVAATGRSEAYYTDYQGRPQEFLSMAKYGYLYQGQRYKWQKQRRGTPALDLGPGQFVAFLQNHDQIANSGRGERLHCVTSPGRLRALTALLLLGPEVPMLFQGQEFAASSFFYYFADHAPEIAEKVREGRAKEMSQFPSIATAEMQRNLKPPGEVATFEACKLDFADRERNRGIYDLHRDLLRLRREDPAFRSQRKGALDGAVLGPECLVLRYFVEGGDDRLLLVNWGPDLALDPAPEPLLAPPAGKLWRTLWSSEDPHYGGTGTPELDSEENWRIPGNAAVALAPEVRGPETEDV